MLLNQTQQLFAELKMTGKLRRYAPTKGEEREREAREEAAEGPAAGSSLNSVF